MAAGSRTNKGEVIVLVGTRKGGFILSSNSGRQRWSLSGPFMPGNEVFHLISDPRNPGKLFAAVNQTVWGPEIQFSRDLGQTWSLPKEPPRFSGEAGQTVKRVWHIEPGEPSQPEILYAGVEPAALFKTEDGGATWYEVSGLTSHTSRSQWQPGLGGLCLHSIVLDPASPGRAWVGISAVGVFGTHDGGLSWQAMNQGIRADFLPDPFPKFGQCPHKVLAHPATPEVLYQQNHCGVYRSDNGGYQWADITGDLPSRFGFALGLHARDPDTLYVLPEDAASVGNAGGGLRYVTDAKFRVFRSRNKGNDWEPLTAGLPQENAYLHVLREGMATDHLDPCGIYLGTTTGQLFYSRDDGDHWGLLWENLPPILSVECGSA